LPDSHRYAIYVALKALGKDRQVTKADKKHVAALLETSLTTVHRIWTAAQEQERAGKRIVEVDVSSKKKGNCGRKKLELGLSRIPSIELNKRSTLRGLSWELNVPYATAVTQHTTACCSMQVVDITIAEQASTNITSLGMVQQKHCGPKYKVIHIYYIPKRDDIEMLPIKGTLLVLSVYNN
jgi:hypothetical protein